MKTLYVILSAGFLILSSCVSEFKIIEADVPFAVVNAFHAKYPGATNVTWEAEKTEGHLAFEAEFKIADKSKEVYFKPDGTFLKEE